MSHENNFVLVWTDDKFHLEKMRHLTKRHLNIPHFLEEDGHIPHRLLDAIRILCANEDDLYFLGTNML